MAMTFDPFDGAQAPPRMGKKAPLRVNPYLRKAG